MPSKKPYSTADLVNILQTVQNVMNSTYEALRGNETDSWSAQSLAIAMGPEAETATSLFGYGKTPEEAQARAGLVCIKWKCSQLPGFKNQTIETFKSYSPEKLIDFLLASGRPDLIPKNANFDKQEFKQNFLVSLESKTNSCSDDQQPIAKISMYVMCVSSGATLKKNF
ncbi:MAG: hypothetical protein AABY64_09335 [Bdellovibrionota bacterium]